MDRVFRLKPVLFFLLLVASKLSFANPETPYVVGVFEGIEREIAVAEGELVGRFSPYYECVFSRVEGNFRFVEMPLAQILYQLDKGGIAAGLPLVQTSRRDEYADFGGLLFQTEYVYLLVEDLPPLDSLSGLRYGFVRRFVGDQLLRGEDPSVTHVSDWEQAVEMLIRGRVDLVVLPWVLVDYYMDGFEGDYYERTAAWVDLSLYISHEGASTNLTNQIRRSVRECRFISEKKPLGADGMGL